MHVAARGYRIRRRLVVATGPAGLALVAPSARRPLRLSPAAPASAPAEPARRLPADPFTYFRFINRVWIACACEAIADVRDLPIVRLRSDAHAEQVAVTETSTR